MRFSQLLRFAVTGLRRQPVRTLLTVVGVAVGTCTLAIGLSLGLGLRALVDREFLGRPGFWQVTVFPGGAVREADADIPESEVRVEGTFAPDRAARLRKHLVRRYRAVNQPKRDVPLDDAAVRALAAVPDVTEVRTARTFAVRAALDGPPAAVQALSARPDVEELSGRLVAGRLPAEGEPPAAVVSETLLYDLGLRDDAAMRAAVGRPLRLEPTPLTGPRPQLANLLPLLLSHRPTPTDAAAAGKLFADLPGVIDRSPLSPAEKASLTAALAPPADAGPPPAVAVPVAGVVRAPDGKNEQDLVYRFRDGWKYANADVFLPRPVGDPMSGRGEPHDSVNLLVRPGADLPAVDAAAAGLGFTTASAAEWYGGAKAQATAIAAGLNVFALVALFVAGLGITNTLVTSVVERTREIGVLKAVGASGRQVGRLFLAEGGLIGLTGGLLGLVAARLIAGPADDYVKGVVQSQAKLQGEQLLTTTVFEFPPWLCGGAVLFAALTTTLAAYYPARRAARLAPVEALRHA